MSYIHRLLACALAASLPASASAGAPERNPFLAAETYAIAHFDPAQTDSIPYPAPRGTFRFDLRKQPTVVGGPINIMTLASTSPDLYWGVSSDGVTAIDAAHGAWKEMARLRPPSVKPILLEQHRRVLDGRYGNLAELEKAVAEGYGLDMRRIFNGIYSVVDRDDVVYANYNGPWIHAFGLVDPRRPAAGIRVLRSFDVSALLQPEERLVGLSLTYDGQLIVVGSRSLALIDRSFRGPTHVVRFGADERISNSVAVDEHNAIYVASDKVMRKVMWTGAKLSQHEADGAWASPYDSGRQPPTVKVGTGTGSTPTLMGFAGDADELVVITDGSDRMKLVAFWRNAIPEGFTQRPGTASRRIAGQIQVTCGLSPLPEFVQTEQSVVSKGYGAFVVNNIGKVGHADKLIDVIALGPVLAPPTGAERFEWDPAADAWRSVWRRADVSSTSMVPAVSVPSNLVLVNGYGAADGWEVTGLDWQTGQTVLRTIFGQDNFGNGAYAILQLLPDGDLLFNGIAGPSRLHFGAP